MLLARLLGSSVAAVLDIFIAYLIGLAMLAHILLWINVPRNRDRWESEGKMVFMIFTDAVVMIIMIPLAFIFFYDACVPVFGFNNLLHLTISAFGTLLYGAVALFFYKVSRKKKGTRYERLY